MHASNLKDIRRSNEYSFLLLVSASSKVSLPTPCSHFLGDFEHYFHSAFVNFGGLILVNDRLQFTLQPCIDNNAMRIQIQIVINRFDLIVDQRLFDRVSRLECQPIAGADVYFLLRNELRICVATEITFDTRQYANHHALAR